MIQNKRGLSLIEMLIAMVVLLIVSLAMMQTALVSVDSNMRNILRDEGVMVAEESIEGLRELEGEQLDSQNGSQVVVSRSVRNIASMDYTVDTTVKGFVNGPSYRRVSVRVSWDWKGETYETTLATLR